MQRILLISIGGFLTGVGIQSVTSVDIYTTAALILGAAVLAYVGAHRSLHQMLLVSLAVFTGSIGVVRVEIAQTLFDRALVLTEGSSVERTATIITEPDLREEQTILTLALDRVLGERDTIVVRVHVPQYPVFTYGEHVTVRGVVEVPRAFETDTGRMFDYRGYLMKEGVHYEVLHAHVVSRGDMGGSPIIRSLLHVKNAWLGAVSHSVSEPSASLLGGIIVGAKRSLGDAWLDAFRKTGIVHIVVLSGYNLTLIALFVVWLTKPFSRTVRLGGGIIGIIAFALMTGGGATVVRASIMAVLGMLALFLSRPYAIMRALIGAAFLMVCINPFLLIHDPGFQLSFIATLGLILGTPIVEQRLHYVSERFGLRTVIATTLATQCAVLPLLAYQMGTASLIAPIVNVLVLPVIPLTMALGFSTGVLGMLATALAVPFAWLTHILTGYIFWVVEIFSSVPFATLSLPRISGWFVVFVYVLAVTYFVRIQKPRTPLVAYAGRVD